MNYDEDANGNISEESGKAPYDHDAWKHDTSATYGATGLAQNSGVFTQDEILRSLQFPQGMFVFREMYDNDPTVGAMMFAIEQLIKTVKYSAQPFDDSPEAVAYASHLESCLGDLEKPFHDYVMEFMTMLVFGFSLNAIEFKKRVGPSQVKPKFRSKYKDGRWGFRGFPTRSQESITGWLYQDLEEPNLPTHAVQRPPTFFGPNSTDLDMSRLLHFRVSTRKDNPESRSILRNAHQPYFYKKHYERDQSIRISRDARGLPVFGVPGEWMSSSALPGDKMMFSNLQKAALNMYEGRQKALFKPVFRDQNGNDLVTIDYLKNDTAASYDVEAIIGRLTKEILQTVLADFIEMGNTSVGSFALSSNKTKMFSMAVSGWLDEISNSFQKAIRQLAILEGWKLDKLPTLSYTDLESVDLDVYGTFLEKMAKSGIIVPDDMLEKAVRKESGLPEAKTEGQRDVGAIAKAKEKAEKLAEAAKKDAEKIKTDGISQTAKTTATSSNKGNMKTQEED